MKSLNKKKINYFLGKKFIKFITIFFLISSSAYIFYNFLYKNEYYKTFIINFSKNFNYEFKYYDLNELENVNKADVISVINKYINTSIFLLPLKEISNYIRKIEWVENVEIYSDLQNSIKINIREFQPIGLYNFNENLYFFSKDGKIITKLEKNLSVEGYIVFSGKNCIEEARYLIEILKKLETLKIEKVKKADYINKRRWNLLLDNNILLYLSEKNIEDSLNNYNKIIKNIENINFNSIDSIDLRNNVKAIIKFK